MNQPDTVEHTHHRLTHWGPVARVHQGLKVGATVGGEVVELKLPYRPPAERIAEPFPQHFVQGVPALWNGEEVAMVRAINPGKGGLVRRSHYAIVGDERFVLPGMSFSERPLPGMLTLSYDGGALVASQGWAAPLNIVGTEFLPFWDAPIPPRMTRTARLEHTAFWFTMWSMLL